jgi:hypothetical protein
MTTVLTLQVSTGEGFLAPHLDGRRSGRAVAGCCTACGRVALPPEAVCTCGAAVARMVDLGGGAAVVWRCDGADGSAGLVRFDGADTLSLARLEGLADAARGRIRADAGAALVLGPEDVA